MQITPIGHGITSEKNKQNPNFKARLVIRDKVRLDKSTYKKIKSYVDNIGNKSDIVAVAKKKVQIILNGNYKETALDVFKLKMDERGDKIRETIDSLLTPATIVAATALASVSSGKTDKIDETEENQPVANSVFKNVETEVNTILNTIEEFPKKIKFYPVGKEPKPDSKLEFGATTNTIRAKIEDKTYNYKVVNGIVNGPIYATRYDGSDFIYKPSDIKLTNGAALVLDSVTVDKYTATFEHFNYASPRLLKIETKLPAELDNGKLVVHYRWSPEENSSGELTARPKELFAYLPNKTINIEFKDGKPILAHAIDNNTGEEVAITCKGKVSKATEAEEIPKARNYNTALAMCLLVDHLKNKYGNIDFTTDPYDKTKVDKVVFDENRMRRDKCYTAKSLSKLIDNIAGISPKYYIYYKGEQPAGIYQTKPKITVQRIFKQDPFSDDPYEGEDIVNYIHDSGLVVRGHMENGNLLRLDCKNRRLDDGFLDNDLYLFNTKNGEITCIRQEKNRVIEEKINRQEEYTNHYIWQNFYKKHISSYELKSEDLHEFAEYYTGEYAKYCFFDDIALAGRIYKDGNDIIGLSITESSKKNKDTQAIERFTLTKHPNSDDIILSSKEFGEELRIKARNLDELEAKAAEIRKNSYDNSWIPIRG